MATFYGDIISETNMKEWNKDWMGGLLKKLSLDDFIGDTLGFQLLALSLGTCLRLKSPDEKTILPPFISDHI